MRGLCVCVRRYICELVFVRACVLSGHVCAPRAQLWLGGRLCAFEGNSAHRWMCLRHGFLEGRRPNRALERLVERATHSSEEWRWVRLPGGAVCVMLVSSRLVPRGLAGLPGGGVCITLTSSRLVPRGLAGLPGGAVCVKPLLSKPVWSMDAFAVGLS